MAKVYISLGTNLGDKEQNLRTAVQKIEEQVGKVISLSAFYITAPWGFDSEHSFLNAAACVETELSPLEVLQKTQEIERELGRTHKSVGGVYSDRLIDIDLLLYDDLILSVTSPSGAALNLPHPLMAERDFVMRPLTEIAPELVHPVLSVSLIHLTAPKRLRRSPSAGFCLIKKISKISSNSFLNTLNIIILSHTMHTS